MPGGAAIAFALSLALTAPPPVSAKDLVHFPDFPSAEANSQWATQHSVRADRLYAEDPCEYHAVLMHDLDWRYRCWLDLRYAHTNAEFPERTVAYLTTLRARIGDDAYRRGEMPCPVPLHLYPDITFAPRFRPLTEDDGTSTSPPLMERLP